MRPYSLDLRQRIVEAYENGEGTQAELAERFQVSLRCVERLMRVYRETGSVAPKPHGGGRQAKISGESAERLLAAVEETPDATLAELLTACQVSGSIMCVFRALRRLGITLKKSHYDIPNS